MSEWDEDPRLRWLRIGAALVLLGLIAFIVIDPSEDNPVTVGTLVGALLVDLGFEAGMWTKGRNGK